MTKYERLLEIGLGYLETGVEVEELEYQALIEGFDPKRVVEDVAEIYLHDEGFLPNCVTSVELEELRRNAPYEVF